MRDASVLPFGATSLLFFLPQLTEQWNFWFSYKLPFPHTRKKEAKTPCTLFISKAEKTKLLYRQWLTSCEELITTYSDDMCNLASLCLSAVFSLWKLSLPFRREQTSMKWVAGERQRHSPHMLTKVKWSFLSSASNTREILMVFSPWTLHRYCWSWKRGDLLPGWHNTSCLCF